MKMAKKKETGKPIEQYEHRDKDRANIPPVGLVTPKTDPDKGQKKKYEYDPHLDPQLQWAGKAGHTSFEVPTVSLHVHERIDPKTIIDTVRKEHDDGGQLSLFEESRMKPLREAIDFYKHKEGWSNRLIAGDSLLVMNSLIEKEGMAGKVQMFYIDPPYGIRYGSNFQPFVNNRDVKENDNDLTSEPEMIKAFRDTWELGIHSYLSYLRDRLKLGYNLLHESGSCFVQIGEDNLHLVRNLCDEIFGTENFMSIITFRVKNMPFGAKYLENMYDHVIWYAKKKDLIKYRQLFTPRNSDPAEYSFIELSDGARRKLTEEEKDGKIPEGARLFARLDMYSSGYTPTCIYDVEFEGKIYKPQTGKSWKTTKEGMEVLKKCGRVINLGSKLYFVNYFEDYPVSLLTNFWNDTAGGYSEAKRYIVETHPKVVQRCLLMATDPGDLVVDITCGSGTTAYVSEQWGRRWLTCDTSRIAITLAKQRLMKGTYLYYELAYPEEGIGSGLKYEKVPHVTLGSIANNIKSTEEILVDRPIKDSNKIRITGPFTVEAVPAPYAKSFDDLEYDTPEAMSSEVADSPGGAYTSIARTGETLRQSEWRDELLLTGVRAKGGNMIHFTRVEPMGGTKFIQAEAETKEDIPKKVLVVFGPEHAPLEQRMVENAWQEARALKPDMLLFCAFQFDEESAKDIDELTPEIAGMQMLKAQMNADLLTDDLRKKRSSNESFWLVGQPDIKILKQKGKGTKIQVEVMGFDYYNPRTGNVESGGKKNIAMWMIDTDYDNRSLFPSQVFYLSHACIHK